MINLIHECINLLSKHLPVGEVLMREIYSFITIDRNKVKNAKGNDFLFITNKLGKTVGMPLSTLAYHKIINIIIMLSLSPCH